MSDGTEEVEKEIDRLADLLPVYLCERTGLSMEQITQVLDSQETFWESQPHVMARLIILGHEIEIETDEDAGA